MGFQKIWYLQPPKRKLGTSKKWVHFPWTLRLLEPFQVDFRQKPFSIRFSTFIWHGYQEIILEFGQMY